MVLKGTGVDKYVYFPGSTMMLSGYLSLGHPGLGR